jgi:regulator of protease activity HflC (stomatin/prohibitin superfamily)
LTEAFSKIVELLVAWWHAIRFWEILDVEEVGFVRRLGKPHRMLKPGLNWRWPVIEKASTENAQEGNYVLDPQSLRTKDGVDIILRVSVTFKVINVQHYFLQAWGALNNIRDLVAGEVGEAVRESTAEAVYSGAALQLALKRSRKHAKKWGIGVIRLRCIDAARGRSYRLWNTNTSATGQG